MDPLDLLSHETFMHWVFVKPPGTFKANLGHSPMLAQPQWPGLVGSCTYSDPFCPPAHFTVGLVYKGRRRVTF